MKPVAIIKYRNNANASPYDAAQEVRVLKAVEAQAVALNLPGYGMLNFAQIQMDLSKQIEAYWILRWKNKQEGVPKAVEGLPALRKKINIVDGVLYPAIKAAQSAFSLCSVDALSKILHEQFKQAGVDETALPLQYYSMLAFSLKTIGLTQ